MFLNGVFKHFYYYLNICKICVYHMMSVFAGVTSENITLNPSSATVTCGLDHLSRRRSFMFSKQKVVTYSIDNIAACVLRTEPNKSCMYYYNYYCFHLF